MTQAQPAGVELRGVPKAPKYPKVELYHLDVCRMQAEGNARDLDSDAHICVLQLQASMTPIRILADESRQEQERLAMYQARPSSLTGGII